MRPTPLLLFAGVLLLGACSSSGAAGRPSSVAPGSDSTGAPQTSRPASSTAAPATTTPRAASSATTAPSAARRVFDAMSLRERVGQLLMVDCPSTSVGADTLSAIDDHAVGSVILDGTTHSGASAVRAVTTTLRDHAPKGVGLFVATDQEGGLVQRLQGPGFDTVPGGVEQGRIAPDTLRHDAAGWGRQLAGVGVNLDLAPVLDTVPAGGGSNPPIGDLDRQFGSTPATVQTHGLAVVHGLLDAGVDPTVKHFPGLGRVTGNTDTTSGVTDDVTTSDDPYLQPFRAAVDAGAPFVMMSTAIYSRIDPDHPAAFSSTIVTGLLRQQLGFGGVVISDDVGAAKQVASVPVGQRAVDFVAAGGDLVLTVDAGQAGAMTSALSERAGSDPAFRAKVDAAALRVLTAKQARGLLG